MRLMTIARSLAAGLTAGGLSLVAVPLAAAAPAGTFSVPCQTSTYPVFDWNVTVDATAEANGPATTLTLQLSDLPGVAPVPMRDLGMTANIEAEVNGTPITLSGQGFVSFEAETPFAIPPASATIVGQPEQLDVVIRSMSYDIPSFQMDTICPPGEGVTELRLHPIAVAGIEPPAPVQTQAPRQKKPAAPVAASESPGEASDDEQAGDDDVVAPVQSAGIGGALPLVGGSALVLAVLAWFVFFRKPRAGSTRA